ncbi:MAG: hypothetical protein BWY44_01381 [Candidatus Omnitrophica bacterium ADurb.Bin292]|nr:MAG: hypothetical protein BWY44_01381 [Candidatus Omnitrophica bacterium ADurb.Bin292]
MMMGRVFVFGFWRRILQISIPVISGSMRSRIRSAGFSPSAISRPVLPREAARTRNPSCSRLNFTSSTIFFSSSIMRMVSFAIFRRMLAQKNILNGPLQPFLHTFYNPVFPGYWVRGVFKGSTRLPVQEIDIFDLVILPNYYKILTVRLRFMSKLTMCFEMFQKLLKSIRGKIYDGHSKRRQYGERIDAICGHFYPPGFCPFDPFFHFTR